MSVQGLYSYRRITGIFALVGILFYAALTPLHAASEANRMLLGAELAGALSIICHSRSSAASERPPHGAVPKAPVLPKKYCPFCQGCAAFQIAIAHANANLVPRVRIRAPVMDLAFERLVSMNSRAPQSRAPPALPA
jgi:hypothetical protein